MSASYRGCMAAASRLVLGFRQTNRAATSFPLTTLFHELNALKALENRTFAANGRGRFEAIVLRHEVNWLAGEAKASDSRMLRQAENHDFFDKLALFPAFFEKYLTDSVFDVNPPASIKIMLFCLIFFAKLVTNELWWQRADLNRRPKAYESSALPLSYSAVDGS